MHESPVMDLEFGVPGLNWPRSDWSAYAADVSRLNSCNRMRDPQPTLPLRHRKMFGKRRRLRRSGVSGQVVTDFRDHIQKAKLNPRRRASTTRAPRPKGTQLPSRRSDRNEVLCPQWPQDPHHRGSSRPSPPCVKGQQHYLLVMCCFAASRVSRQVTAQVCAALPLGSHVPHHAMSEIVTLTAPCSSAYLRRVKRRRCTTRTCWPGSTGPSRADATAAEAAEGTASSESSVRPRSLYCVVAVGSVCCRPALPMVAVGPILDSILAATCSADNPWGTPAGSAHQLDSLRSPLALMKDVHVLIWTHRKLLVSTAGPREEVYTQAHLDLLGSCTTEWCVRSDTRHANGGVAAGCCSREHDIKKWQRHAISTPAWTVAFV